MNEASLEQLEESLRGHESLSEVENFNELTQKYIDTTGKLSALQGDIEGRVKIPGEDASEDEVKAYRAALGLPETADLYEIERPEMPEGMPYDEQREAQFKQFAHELSLTPTQVNKMIKWEAENATKIFNDVTEQSKASEAKAEEALKTDWGEKYDENMNQAKRLARNVGGEEFTKWLNDSGVGNDPGFIKFAHKLASLVSNDTLGEELQPGGTGGREINPATGEAVLNFPSMKE